MTYHTLYWQQYRTQDFEKGSRKFKKFEKDKVQKENRPKSVEDQKKRSSLKFSPNFCPKLGEHQKKKRSSPKFSPIFCPNLGTGQ